ncbi:MAG TPA: CAP domain-containing protein [Candidatus Binatia bacterium]|jgi:uncharacterized protein YkwD|nr:CAP domain-containing protein [Candidatus Binatia bacterium]
MRVLVIVSLLLTVAGSATAADPCKSACKTAKKSCLRSAAGAYATAKAACGADAATRKACVTGARAERTAAKSDCKAAFSSCKAVCGGGPTGGGTCRASSFGDWLASVNGWRALAGLPAVTEDASWSAGALAHARYVVREDQVGHTESASSANFSAEGLAAAQNGNVAGTSDIQASEGWAIDAWMTGPFHAVGILDPLLAVSGFGIFHEQGAMVQTGAVLDVLRGRSGAPATAPVVLPADGMVLPVGRYDGNESPDPLASCPGYTAPSGFPLIVLAGPGFSGTTVTAHALSRGGTPVEHCVFDGTTYTNPDPAAQSSGRNVLGARDAVVIMAKEPLVKGAGYEASLVVNGQTLAWSFTVDCP